jgi:hypothetical protein
MRRSFSRTGLSILSTSICSILRRHGGQKTGGSGTRKDSSFAGWCLAKQGQHALTKAQPHPIETSDNVQACAKQPRTTTTRQDMLKRTAVVLRMPQQFDVLFNKAFAASYARTCLPVETACLLCDACGGSACNC